LARTQAPDTNSERGMPRCKTQPFRPGNNGRPATDFSTISPAASKQTTPHIRGDGRKVNGGQQHVVWSMPISSKLCSLAQGVLWSAYKISYMRLELLGLTPLASLTIRPPT